MVINNFLTAMQTCVRPWCQDMRKASEILQKQRQRLKLRLGMVEPGKDLWPLSQLSIVARKLKDAVWLASVLCYFTLTGLDTNIWLGWQQQVVKFNLKFGIVSMFVRVWSGTAHKANRVDIFAVWNYGLDNLI